MNRNNVDVRLLIKGRPITEYLHNGNTFVEGRSGSNFEIEIINRNSFQIEAIISVDGLSVIDGKDASEQSSGYLLKANETLRVPGWKLDDKTVAAFVFAGKEGSYATQTTGSSRNTGVIGVMAFREKPAVHHYYSHTFASTLPNAFPAGAMVKGMGSPLRSRSASIDNAGADQWYSTCNNMSLTSSNMAVGTAATLSSVSPGVSTSEVNQSYYEPTAVTQSLGTGFGAATEFATQTVSFTRGDMLAMAVLYYDNLRGLRARGVPVERTGRRTYQAQPQAFPGMNCAPPKNWQG